MSTITIYVKPTCSTCRKAVGLLHDAGADFEAINYYEQPLTVERLAELAQQAGVNVRDLLRSKESKAIGLVVADRSDQEILQLMASNPDLIQRPIAECGGVATVARPPELVLRLLK